MGKQQTSDKMHISYSELQMGGHGHGRKAGADAIKHQSKPLSCFHCALSLSHWETPAMVPSEGHVYELTQIIPFIRKYKKNPATGEALSGKDVTPLHFHKNTEGEWACPVTGKVLTENSKVVAIKTTGNVYSWDAVQMLNVQAKNWKDLLTDEAFTKADIVLLQDPFGDPEWLKKRDVNGFFHVRTSKSDLEAMAVNQGGGEGHASSTSSTTITSNGAGGGVIRADDTTRRVLAELNEREKEGTLPTISGVKRKQPDGGHDHEDNDSGAGGGGHVTSLGVKTTGRFAASLTSTGVSVVTKNEAASETEEDRLAKRWEGVKALGKKAYVRMTTSKGPLNLELHADLVPRTVDNFLALAKRGYYNGTSCHRLIHSFVAQLGDPTGTGTGGESCWASSPEAVKALAAAAARGNTMTAFGRSFTGAGGSKPLVDFAAKGCPFRDEFSSKLSHSERGILSMANSGADSNKSQFFVTLKSCPHLDNKHSVFGRVVGGLETLRAIELVETKASRKAASRDAFRKGGGAGGGGEDLGPDRDRPLEEIKIVSVEVFSDPFAEWEQKDKQRRAEEKEKKDKERERERERQAVLLASSSSSSGTATTGPAKPSNALGASLAALLPPPGAKAASSSAPNNDSNGLPSSSSSPAAPVVGGAALAAAAAALSAAGAVAGPKIGSGVTGVTATTVGAAAATRTMTAAEAAALGLEEPSLSSAVDASIKQRAAAAAGLAASGVAGAGAKKGGGGGGFGDFSGW